MRNLTTTNKTDIIATKYTSVITGGGSSVRSYGWNNVERGWWNGELQKGQALRTTHHNFMSLKLLRWTAYLETSES